MGLDLLDEEVLSGEEVSLPSGAKLIVKPAPFSEAKNLWRACSNELLRLKINMTTNIDVNFIKDAICIASSSPEIEAALIPCLRRCLYAGMRINDGTFEKEDARKDYLLVLAEVLKVNVFPFLEGPLSKLGIDLAALKESFAPKSLGN